MSDEEALEQYLLSQNVNYFNLLYDRYTDKVYAKCISMLRDQELAEDATQEIFVKILLSLSKFNGKSKFSTWLYSITYNYCIDQIRKVKKENTVTVNDFSRIDQIDDDMYDSEIKETNVFRLKEVMERLSAEDKSILMMKYQDDLSIRDICNILDKTESAVKMKILRAKEKFLKIYHHEFKELAS
ncbi:MAG: RNA polymerase sigma factor [Saprospiraceae bacterium]|nr:RNA polymerase sigma factor [Saprospiraceae bacterium]MBK9565279.1 RNA polymerase sigma factor [Saprospiraceae bacterium]